MDWFKKHADTAVVLGAIFGVFIWMQAEFRDLDRRLTRIETVQKIMTTDLPTEAKDGHVFTQKYVDMDTHRL